MASKMLNFVPEEHILGEFCITFLICKNTCAESYWLLVETYGEHALTQKLENDLKVVMILI